MGAEKKVWDQIFLRKKKEKKKKRKRGCGPTKGVHIKPSQKPP